MDRLIPLWRVYREELNRAPLSHEDCVTDPAFSIRSQPLAKRTQQPQLNSKIAGQARSR
ncbi:hypothetical protein Ga0074115_11065 [endosymbiont of Ridgeia piscesae]|jgi:hypothetical protein|uniref:Uncharacterized protein n=1 Tax=endosymbiont of Ridgeia piscesae TaxID=54398 RepID=A0A0T5YW69_9GAMM|nr:hypothetical protein Ga0074115_11065 [endosymbiont of Ridgeia piscesae]KRT59201.1 hypothetical protein Ga0076813_15018 [endosymbiont of Ridgeia piscesae]